MSMNKKDPKNNPNQKEEAESDVVNEEIEEDNFSEKSSDHIKKLKNKLKKCEKEKTEYLDGWLRAKSDMVNLRKKYEKEAENSRFSSEKKFAEKLLPVMDSFSMAITDQDTWKELPEGWRKGMENIYSQFKKIFSDYEIYSFSPKGEMFDPNFHEAIGIVDIDDINKDNIITEVIQEGYTHRDELIRTAKVKVGHYPEEEKTENNEK